MKLRLQVHSQDYMLLNVSKSFKKNQQSNCKDFKRMTRSSFGNIANTTFTKSKGSPTPLSKDQSAQKQIKNKKTANAKKMGVATKLPKRMAASGIPNIEKDANNIKHKCKLITLPIQKSIKKAIKSKHTVKEKVTSVQTKIPKCLTRSSIENVEMDALSDCFKRKHKLKTFLSVENRIITKRKSVKLKETNVKTKYPKRMTRSSLENVKIDTLSNSKIPEDKLITALLHQSKEKCTEHKKTTKEKTSVETKYPKRVTRSSLENIEINTLPYIRKLKDKLITLDQTTAKELRQKQNEQLNSKRLTRSSCGSGTVSHTSKKNSLKKRLVASPSNKSDKKKAKLNVSKHDETSNLSKNSELINQSSLESIACVSISKDVDLNSSHSDEKIAGGKQNEQETCSIQENSKRITRHTVSNVLPLSEAPDEVNEKRQSKTRKMSGIFNSREVVKTGNMESTTVAVISPSRKRNSKSTSGSQSNTHNEAPVLETDEDKNEKKQSKTRKKSVNSTKVAEEASCESALMTISNPRNSKSGSSTAGSQNNKQSYFSSKVRENLSITKSPRGNYFDDIPIDCLSFALVVNRNSHLVTKSSQKSSRLQLNNSSYHLAGENFKITTEHNNDKEEPKRNSRSSNVAKGVKRKSCESPLTNKISITATQKTPLDNEKDIPLDCLSSRNPSKRPRRHTVDLPLATSKMAKNPSTTQQEKKKTSTTKKKHSLKQKKDVSSSAPLVSPDISIDCLAASAPVAQTNKQRPKSAPAAGKGAKTPIPRKGTLKRQRWMFNALKEKNEGYEDDIFENQKFNTPVFQMPLEVDDESDTSIATPKFGVFLTPALPKKTPKYKDSISASDLLLARRRAEEYHFRRNKKRTSGNSILESLSSSQASVSCDGVPEKKKLVFAEVMSKVTAVQKSIEMRKEDESEEEDAYFSDAS